MQITCPCCNAKYALEAALSDADARRAVIAAGRLPGSVGELVLQYVGLFRPAKSALSWRRVARLTGEVLELIDAGAVRRKGRDWPAGISDFRTALETVLSQRQSLTLPLKGHGYLEEVLVGVVHKREGQAEQATEVRRQRGDHRRADLGGEERAPRPARDVAKEIEDSRRAQWDRELGIEPGQAGTG